MNKRVYENVGETLYTETLENGLTVQVAYKPDYQKSFAIFATDYGGADRRFLLDGVWHDTPAGVAHFLEHKMFDMPQGNALTALSAGGANPNAFTGQGITAYHFSCTDGFYAHLRTLLTFVSTPYFTAESVEKEQGIIGQEIRMVEDSPPHAGYYGLLGALYAHHPVRESVAGTVESIAGITPEVLGYCHRAFYRPSNMTLCCVGPLEPERIVALARELLPAERGDVPQRDHGPEETLSALCPRWERTMAVSAPQFLLGAKAAPTPAGPDRLRQRLTGELALSYLVGESSPFYTRLYGEGLLERSFSYEFDQTAGTATVLLGGESKAPEQVAQALRQSVDEAANGFDDVRFRRCRKALYGQYLRALGSFEALAVSLAEGRFGGWSPLDVFVELPALTGEACAAFVRETLSQERLALSVILPGK